MIKTISKQDIDSYVGKRLRQRRTMMGLSQEAVANAVGVTFQQVQKYEKGTNAMNARRLVEFARFMNVPVAYFFEGMEEGTIANVPAVGFAESDAEMFDHKRVSDRESLELMKAFKKIKEHNVRKRVADMVRAIADSKPIIE